MDLSVLSSPLGHCRRALFLFTGFHASTFLPSFAPRLLAVSQLLRRLCHLPGTVLRTPLAAMNSVPSRLVIPDSSHSNFQPFYLQPPHALLGLRSLSLRISSREVAVVPSPGRLPFLISPFPSRLISASGRIEFIIVLFMDWLFASGCSPPRLSTTQLPSATDSQCSV